MDRPEDDDELLQKLKTHRKNILLELHRNGEMPISTLRETAQFPTGSRNHHTGVLQDWELIELIGRDGEDGERVFGLTENGEQFVESYLEPAEPDKVERRIDRLEDRCEGLDERKLEAARFERLTDYLENEYWDGVIEQIEARTDDKAED